MVGQNFPASISLPATTLCVGLSGGLDSTVLLHWLAGQASVRTHGLRALHVHHGLQDAADHWAEHCQTLCAQLGVELVVARVQVRSDLGLGPEAAARDARHGAFAAHLRDGEILALAHHQDDQAETVLLRLLRGSSSQGLAAMREFRPFAGSKLWRPLLSTPRAVLLEYAATHTLTWIEDPSNEDTRLDRNFLRHNVLPLLHERWPQAAAALAQSARWLDEDAALLDAEAQRRLAQAQGGAANTLSVAILLSFEPMWRARVLRAWLRSREFLSWPQSAHAVIDAEVLTARSDALPEYRWSGGILRRWRDHLYLDHSQSELPQGWSCEWDGMAALALPTGDTLAFIPETGAAGNASRKFTLAPFPVVVRARRGGERIVLPSRQHSHCLKHVLQQHGVPPWRRAQLPLLFASDGELLAAGDAIVSARLLEYCRENAVRVHFQSW